MTQAATGLSSGTFTVTITDANGCTVDGSVDVVVTGIEIIEQLETLQVSPNPGTGIFNVLLELNTPELIQIDLISLSGKIIRSIKEEVTLGDNYLFDISKQPSGLYMLKLQIGHKILTKKLMLIR